MASHFMSTEKPEERVSNSSPPSATSRTSQPAHGNSSDEENQAFVAQMSTVRETLFIIVLCSTQFFVQGSFGSILIPLRIVGATFHQTSAQSTATLAWHVAAYSLTVGTFILPSGKLGDIYGSKRILIGGWLWFALWSIIGGCSAFTGNAVFFDVCRALQGIGPAMILPNGLAIAGRTYQQGMKRNVVFSLFAMTAPLGCCAWGAVGSALAEFLWWPWSMWLTALGCVLVALVGYLVVPADDTAAARIQNEARFDWEGAACGVLGLLLLNISWVQAPIVGWAEPYIIVLLILGFIFVGIFTWHESRIQEPLLDLAVFNPRTTLVLACTGLGWASFSVWFYYLFLFIQQCRGVSPLQTAAQFCPGAVSGIVAAVVTAFLLRTISAGWLMAIACAAFSIGSVLLVTAPVDQPYWFNIFWSFVVEAWGMDISFPASATILSNAVPKEHQGVSASLVNTVVNYSIAIGLGIAGTVEVQFNHEGEEHLVGYRAAMWVAVALSGAALLLSVSFAILESIQNQKTRRAGVSCSELEQS